VKYKTCRGSISLFPPPAFFIGNSSRSGQAVICTDPKQQQDLKQDRVMQRSKADRNMHMKESLKKE
jgi:hypothetical protein